MDYLEEITMMHLTKVRNCFVFPQFDIRGDKKSEWSCPDFIAMDFKNKIVAVVEVTSSYNIYDLLKKIENKNEQWFDRLFPQLNDLGLGFIDKTWKNEIWVYTRKEHLNKFPLNTASVTIFEDIGYTWSKEFWTRPTNENR